MHYQLLLVAIIGSSVALPVSGEYPTGRNVVISSLKFVLDLGIMSAKKRADAVGDTALGNYYQRTRSSNLWKRAEAV